MRKKPARPAPKATADRARAATAPRSYQRLVLPRVIREVYDLPATDDQLAAVEQALRAAELERKRRMDAAKASAGKGGQAGERADAQAGGPGSSSSTHW